MASVIFLVFVSFCIISLFISDQFNFVESLPLQGQGGRNNNVVYTRYVRRRPIPYSNNYVREVVEVFKTLRRPPPYAFLHDEDLTRFVRCDYDPSMPDCDEGTYSATTIRKPETTMTSTTIQPETSTKSPSTSSITSTTSSSWWNRRTESLSTATTEQNVFELPEIKTSTEKSTNSEEYGEEDENVDNENDDGNGNGDYYSIEKEEDNNSREALEPNNEDDEKTVANAEEDEATDIDANAEVETQTAKPTEKSFLNWF